MNASNSLLRFGIIFLMSFTSLLSFAQSQNTALDTAELSLLLEDAQKQIGMPAVSVAIIKDKKLIYRYDKGFANLEHEVEVSGETVFPLYSLTKPFIAVGAFSLIENGKLNLNDSVSKFVRDIPDNWKQVKVKHLLSHTSGLPDMVGSNPYELRDLTEKEAKERVFALPLRFEVGMKYEYNQTNFWLLKEVIEHISQMPLSNFIIENQFPDAPKGKVFFSSDAREIIKNRATPYFPWVKGKLMLDLTYTNGDYFEACNGFHVTMDEFVEWDKKLKNNELISAESKRKMWQLFPYEDSDKTFSSGWEATMLDGKQAFGFSGAMSTFYRVYPSEDVSVIFLSNGFSNMYNQDAFTDSLIEFILK